MQMTDTKYDTNRWKHIPCSQIEKSNTVKMTILSKAIDIFNVTLIKLTMTYFIKQRKPKKKKKENLNLYQNTKDSDI